MAEGAQGVRAGRAFVEVGVDPTYKRAVSDAERSFEGLGRKIDGIKSRFGNRGLMKDLTELAVGGGAIAGISFLTRTVADASRGISNMVAKLREGKVAASEVAGEMIKGLPILGSLASATEDWLDVFTGIRSQTKGIYEDVEKAAKKMQEIADRNAVVGDFGAAFDAEVKAATRAFDVAEGRITAQQAEVMQFSERLDRMRDRAVEQVMSGAGIRNDDVLKNRPGEILNELKGMGQRPKLEPMLFRGQYPDDSAVKVYDARRKVLEDELNKIEAVTSAIEKLNAKRAQVGIIAIPKTPGAIEEVLKSTVPYAPGLDPDTVRRQGGDFGGILRTNGIGGIPMSPEFLGQVEEQIAEQMQEAMRFSSAGTFNAAGIQGLQGQTTVATLTRIATASEDTARELKTRKPLTFTR